MSAIGIAPRFGAHIISAHADYCRSDFMFLRTQSSTMRAAPWERRLKPLRPWGKTYAYAAAIGVATVLATAFI